ncbi:unnamed protein product [Ostreobium quekettii]|uniref:non-specific serine/threonine protein kinase n=1 Tax=Ostreobium quekettii TaxID=121088 RepID=A0A8S1IKJ7_9CHLO|nr:unnamed protein product [Ostreobium quekettii]
MFRAGLVLLCLLAVAGQKEIDRGGAGGREGPADAVLGIEPYADGGLRPRHGRRLLSGSQDDVLLVGKLDGTVTALELETGHILWSFDSGSPLVSSGSSQAGDGVPMARVFPGADGTLYRVQSGGANAKIERLGITVPELVENSPSLSDDGSMILGSQSSTVFYVDIQSGELLRTFSSKDVVDADQFSNLGGMNKEISRSSILPMGRRDYVIQAVDYATGVVQWNVSFSHMHQLDMAIVKDEKAVAGFLSGKAAPESASSSPDAPSLEWGADYSLHAKDPISGLAKWDISFPTPPVVAYTLKGGGQDVLPLWSPDYGLSPPPLASSPGVWSSNEEHIFIGAIAGGGLYALPAPAAALRAALGNRNPEAASTAVVPIEDESQWTMWPVEQGSSGSLKDLSCLPAVKPPARGGASQDYLSATQGTSVAPLERLMNYVMGFFTLTAMVVGAIFFKTQNVKAAEPVGVPGGSNTASVRSRDLSAQTDGSAFATSASSSNFSSGSDPNLSGSTSNTRSRGQDGVVHIGQLQVGPEVMGVGAGGTVVYEGNFLGRPVAVKRVLKEFADIAANEKDILILSDEHPNLVRLFAMESDDEFVYLALEKCQMNLSTLVSSKDGGELLHTRDGMPTEYCLKLVNDIACGLAFIHARGIVHRDIKPHNVLIKDGRAKLSDMGLGRRLVKDQSSFFSAGPGGSSGWQAPEQLKIKDGIPSRQTKSMDVFSLGCVIHYCLTAGGHPFGSQSYGRDPKILKGDPELSGLDKLPLAKHLISGMLESEPSKRPNMKTVLAHPFWWTKRKQLQFLIDLSDRIENEDRAEDKSLLRLLESYVKDATGGNWGARIDPKLISNLGQYRKYTYTSLRDLLRVIRNKHNHFREMSEDLKVLLGPIPEGFLGYFTSRFPELLIATYAFALEHCSQDSPLDKYFPEELRCAKSPSQNAASQGGGNSGTGAAHGQTSMFALAPELPQSTNDESSTGFKAWASSVDSGTNGRVSPPSQKPPTNRQPDDEISLRPEKPRSRPRPAISLTEGSRSRSGPLPPGLGLPPTKNISLFDEDRSRSSMLPPSFGGSPPRSTISLAEDGRSKSVLLPPSIGASQGQPTISIAEEGRSRSGPLPPGLVIPQFRGPMAEDGRGRPDQGLSPPRGALMGDDSRRGGGSLSPGLNLGKRMVPIADDRRTSSGLLSPKLGPLKSGTGTRWDDVLNIINLDQASPEEGAKKSGLTELMDPPSGPTSPVSARLSSRGLNGVRTKSEPRWTSGVGMERSISLMDSGELSVGSPGSRTGPKDYKELQSPVKPKSANQLRPDLPVVGWEEDHENDTSTVLSFPHRPGQQVCDFYVKTGFCKYHERCRFDHPDEYAVRLNEDGLPIRPGQQVCEHYKQTHECKFGGACKFNHPNMKPIYAGSERAGSNAALSF